MIKNTWYYHPPIDSYYEHFMFINEIENNIISSAIFFIKENSWKVDIIVCLFISNTSNKYKIANEEQLALIKKLKAKFL